MAGRRAAGVVAAAGIGVADEEELRREVGGAAVVENPPSLGDAIRGGAALITDATVADSGQSCRLDALEITGRHAIPSEPSR